MLYSKYVAILFGCLLGLVSTYVKADLHAPWDTLLQIHVSPINQGHSTVVNYAGMAADKETLALYLNAVSSVSKSDYAQWSKPEQLAFLINAYNAFTVELILTQYPDIESIKDLGGWFSSPWKMPFITLFGEQVSLDNIEHDMIRKRGEFDEPRMHFAVNCASVGCPALREQAYRGSVLNEQLEQQTQRFLTDRNRNYVNKDTLYLSSIFKWYDDDFPQGFFNNYADFLGLTDLQQQKLRQQALKVRYLDYNWSLNDGR